MDDVAGVLAKLLTGSASSSKDGVPEAEGPSAETLKKEKNGDAPSMPDMSGLLGMLSSGDGGRSAQLIKALEPYLGDGRREKAERACELIKTAYSVRTAINLLGGMKNV